MMVTGAAGQVGGISGRRGGPAGIRSGHPTRSDLDITDAAAVAATSAATDVVVNRAALTNVDAAEADPDAAYAINAVGPGNLAGPAPAPGPG